MPLAESKQLFQDAGKKLMHLYVAAADGDRHVAQEPKRCCRQGSGSCTPSCCGTPSQAGQP